MEKSVSGEPGSFSRGAKAAHLRGTAAGSAECEKLHPLFAKALAFLRRPDLADLPCGKYEIDGSNCRASIFEVELKPFADENRYEVHRAFIDIQAPISGTETIGVATSGPEELAGFDAEKDCAFFKAKGEPWTLSPGEFAIFFPETGAHAPGLTCGDCRKIRKVVIKVALPDKV